MNSLLLSLALSAPQTALAHPPGHPPIGPPPVVAGWPAFRPPGYQPFPPAMPNFPPPFVPVPQAPMTLDEFAKCFKPAPGTHHVCLIHPVTCQPVKVCFTLPSGCGCPKVCVHRRTIEFDYPRHRDIEITFLRNGKVDVDY